MVGKNVCIQGYATLSADHSEDAVADLLRHFLLELCSSDYSINVGMHLRDDCWLHLIDRSARTLAAA